MVAGRATVHRILGRKQYDALDDGLGEGLKRHQVPAYGLISLGELMKDEYPVTARMLRV